MNLMQPLDKELLLAVKCQDLAAVGNLLKQGANPKANNNYGPWPNDDILLESLKTKNAAIVQELVKAGANLERRFDSPSVTPLFLAVELGCKNVVAVLLAGGANVHARRGCSLDLDTPLELATVLGYQDIAHQLIEAGAKLDIFTAADEG